jgi:hypothetical protein
MDEGVAVTNGEHRTLAPVFTADNILPELASSK